MKTRLHTLRQDTSTMLGLAFLATSFIAFASTTSVYSISFDTFSEIFFFNYALTFIYFIIVLRQNKKDTGALFRFPSFKRNVLLLQLFNISAYSLNRTIPVFDLSANWVVGFLLLSNILLLIHILWQQYANTWFNHLLVAVSSIAILFHVYESLYVAHVYHIGILGSWFLGIPLHVFVPALYTWVFIKIVRRFWKKHATFWTTAATSCVVAILFISYFSIQFHKVNITIQRSFHTIQKPYQDKSLPPWVTVSQKLQKNWVTERALKCGIVYTDADNLFGSFGNIRMNERVKHDPLVVIASYFSPAAAMAQVDKINILRYMFDARHQTERKLWRGDNLSTTDIVTNVQLFPDYRLAYTEKTFKIKNSQVQRWRSQQEALYTFYLPEGSVVTSASLWVNGKEEPAYLTTKGKADSAYQAIVGRERRDPLLLHWQEGNRVTLRVFPCTPQEDRQFKIGISSPLHKAEQQLAYKNIDFEGPYWKGATESINIIAEAPLTNISAPFSFREEGTSYTYLGKYNSRWSFAFDAPPLSTKAFTFNGKAFQLAAHQQKLQPFDAQHIYLDINAGWSRKEVNTLWELIKHKKVFVYCNQRILQVTAKNRAAIVKQLRRQNFTLFPFYKITQPEDALVISKFHQLTPTLADLKRTGFIEQTSNFFSKSTIPVRLYNIGPERSPYLKTLQELRAIQLESGSLEELARLLKDRLFYQNQESENTIVNQYGAFQIRALEEAIVVSDAPDHLMRLFEYNDILREIGKNYFHQKELSQQLIADAKEAYVVSPISSLIVLETQEDYDRFGIQKSKNSLQNASIANSGAVPEPKEWLLILLVLFITLWLYFRR